MNSAQQLERAALRARILSLIAQGADVPDEPTRDRLLSDLHAYQLRWLEPYARFSAQLSARALPCDAFRFARISSRLPEHDVRRFRSSGTTQDARSEHAFAELALYDAAARAAARALLFPDRERMQLLILAPRSEALPDSSLSYMLERFVDWFGTEDSTHVWPVDAAQGEQLADLLERASEARQPVALLGTSFAFVHAMDALAPRRFALPEGSRIMQTGGFKGRSRELSASEMLASLSLCFGVAAPYIVAEYGMTELSSQLYETTLRDSLNGKREPVRRLGAPPWLRVTVVDPETLLPLPAGQIGLVRLDDAANLDSVSALQTADLGLLADGGLILHGRAQGAIARGCSITAEDLLRGATR